MSRIAALPRLDDRALWAVALYGGMRAGELRALRWSAVDLAAGRIRVERNLPVDAARVDADTETVEPKAFAVTRSRIPSWFTSAAAIASGRCPTG